jgi:hypothetical protein
MKKATPSLETEAAENCEGAAAEKACALERKLHQNPGREMQSVSEKKRKR